ncbi:hypothetical protein HYZ97_03110 [Candidatus Pacearchaeota archaeon]|nr:hypothetical protein [Candidatus Pacearchaeota archaeon]
MNTKNNTTAMRGSDVLGFLRFLFPEAASEALERRVIRAAPPARHELDKEGCAAKLQGKLYLLTNTPEPVLLRKLPDGRIFGVSFKALPPTFWELLQHEHTYTPLELHPEHAQVLYEAHVGTEVLYEK